MPNVGLALIPAVTLMPCIRALLQGLSWLCYRLSVVAQVLEDKCHHVQTFLSSPHVHRWLTQALQHRLEGACGLCCESKSSSSLNGL